MGWFEDLHAKRIVGTPTMFDRMILKGMVCLETTINTDARNVDLSHLDNTSALSLDDVSALDIVRGMNPSEFIPLPSAPFHILVALTSGEKHGYALMNEVQTLSGGSVRMGPGTLYGTLKRLLEQGLVEESDQRPDPELDDERRRYYRLTALGRRVCAAEADRLASLARVARRNLWPGVAT